MFFVPFLVFNDSRGETAYPRTILHLSGTPDVVYHVQFPGEALESATKL